MVMHDPSQSTFSKKQVIWAELLTITLASHNITSQFHSLLVDVEPLAR